MSAGNPILAVKGWDRDAAAVAIDWELERGGDPDITHLIEYPAVARAWVAGGISIQQVWVMTCPAIDHLLASGILSIRQVDTLLRSGEVKIRPNTHVYVPAIPDEGNAWRVQFWNTVIISAEVAPAHVTFVLSTGGHRTYTTRDRLNEVLRRFGIGVHQHQHEWYVTRGSSHFRAAFFDGIEIEVPRTDASALRPRENPWRRHVRR